MLFSKRNSNPRYLRDCCYAYFGTILLESDLDLTPEMAYKTFDSRWQIEIVMRFYKSACCFDETREHDDYSVIASEFCDFLATVLTFKLINFFDKKRLLERMTYKECMKMLKRAKKSKDDNEDWKLIKINPSCQKFLEELEILPKQIDAAPAQSFTRKRGRPPKNKPNN